MTGRTFRIAKAATREVWFIVMHPVSAGMPVSLARQLASYITSIFEAGELLGEGYTPAFHAYDYGANIGIEVSPRLYDLPRERHDPASDDSDRDEDEDEDEDGGESGGSDEGGMSRRVGGLSVGLSDGGGGGGQDPQSQEDTNHDQMIRESDGLRKLTEELQARFHLDSIGAISYALAVCINTDTDDGPTRCLLVDRNKMAREFPRSSDWDFYPQAFHPAYRNVSSSTPPGFLASLTAAIRGNISARNEGAKRSVRYSPNDLLATKGYTTGALTVPTAEASGHYLTRDKRERLLRIVRGQATPEDLAASKPFARERR
ncbi:hypothetical protein B0T11DRAFT_300364 [Plectosphaerella cucumerina]|uniref:Uncharacterized protein n=1 Tax=Plectosphaerella cucumerina TaxID=40658 RepID=A0A8K0TJF2_9PEZI|nr:hypothetical protein B0T11DRAFT_300364 [Plectosphaerella cucumerina]